MEIVAKISRLPSRLGRPPTPPNNRTTLSRCSILHRGRTRQGRLRPGYAIGGADPANYRDEIVDTLTCRMSNGLVESTNTRIRLLTASPTGSKTSPH
jgi:hypothetical protein